MTAIYQLGGVERPPGNLQVEGVNRLGTDSKSCCVEVKALLRHGELGSACDASTGCNNPDDSCPGFEGGPSPSTWLSEFTAKLCGRDTAEDDSRSLS